jgi:hypothetical protein
MISGKHGLFSDSNTLFVSSHDMILMIISPLLELFGSGDMKVLRDLPCQSKSEDG